MLKNRLKEKICQGAGVKETKADTLVEQKDPSANKIGNIRRNLPNCTLKSPIYVEIYATANKHLGAQFGKTWDFFYGRKRCNIIEKIKKNMSIPCKTENIANKNFT